MNLTMVNLTPHLVEQGGGTDYGYPTLGNTRGRSPFSNVCYEGDTQTDLGGGLSTLNKWVQKFQYDQMMLAPYEDGEKEV